MENWRSFKKINENMQAVHDLVDQYPNLDYERLQEIAEIVRQMMNINGDHMRMADQEFEGEEAEFAKRLIALNLQFQRERISMADVDEGVGSPHREYDPVTGKPIGGVTDDAGKVPWSRQAAEDAERAKKRAVMAADALAALRAAREKK